MGDNTRGGSTGGGVLPVLLSGSPLNFESLGGLGGGWSSGLGGGGRPVVGGTTRVLGGETARVVGGETARVVDGETARVLGGDTAHVAGEDVDRATDGGDTVRVGVGGDIGRAIGGGTDVGKGAGVKGGEDERVRDTFLESREENQVFKFSMKLYIHTYLIQLTPQRGCSVTDYIKFFTLRITYIA